MLALRLSPTKRLSAVIAISLAFFLAEISVGFYTSSLALIADAFHYLNDLIGFIAALVAIRISRRGKAPKEFSFGWQRSQLLGAFFNGVFLAALGLSIFLQSVERFVSLKRVEQPKLVLIVGSVGLALNIISALFLHEHGHDHGSTGAQNQSGDSTSHLSRRYSLTYTHSQDIHANHRHVTNPGPKGKERNLGIFGVFLHVLGDAINNVGVIVTGVVIWFGTTEGRFYADPAVSMGIALMIFGSSFPLVKRSGKILLQSAPTGVDVDEVKKDLEELPGVSSVHELHVWRLDEQKTIASAHVLTDKTLVNDFMEQAQRIEVNAAEDATIDQSRARVDELRSSPASTIRCRIRCHDGTCDEPQCCDD